MNYLNPINPSNISLPHGAYALVGGILFSVVASVAVLCLAQYLGQADFSSFPKVSLLDILSKGRPWVSTALCIINTIGSFFVIGGVISLGHSLCKPSSKVSKPDTDRPHYPMDGLGKIYYNEEEPITTLEIQQDTTLSTFSLISITIFIEDIEAYPKQVEESVKYFVHILKTKFSEYSPVFQFKIKKKTDEKWVLSELVFNQIQKILEDSNTFNIEYCEPITGAERFSKFSSPEIFSSAVKKDENALNQEFKKFDRVSQSKRGHLNLKSFGSYREILHIPSKPLVNKQGEENNTDDD